MKILLADDDKEYVLSLKKYLEKKNKKYEVTLAFDGQEARRSLEGASYDIVFIDCDMPYISGVELIKVVKKENPRARLVMVSGYSGIRKDFAKIAGIDDFLRKPFMLTQIDEIMEKYDGRI